MASIITNTDELQTILNILAEKGAAAGKTYSDAIREYLPLIIEGSVSSGAQRIEFINGQVENIVYNEQEQLSWNIADGNTSMASLIITNNNPKLSCAVQATCTCHYQIGSTLKTAQTTVTASVGSGVSRSMSLRASVGMDATNINWEVSSMTLDWSL